MSDIGHALVFICDLLLGELTQFLKPERKQGATVTR
jgi:hypothetical protein